MSYLTPEALKMVGSSRSTLLLSKIVPACAGPPERYFRSNKLAETGFGRLRWPTWEKGAPQPSPNQNLLSRTADSLSVMRITDHCDAGTGVRLRKWERPRRSTISKAA